MRDTKEYIIDEAFKLFLRHSYEAVSISYISNAIGMTKGALYHHFKNKEELYRLVVDKYLQIPTCEIDVDNINLYDFILLNMEQAEKTIKSIFGNSELYKPIDYISLYVDAARHYPDFAETKSKLIHKEIAKTQTVLEQAMKKGEIRNDIDASTLASQFYSIKMGLAGNLIGNDSVDKTIRTMNNQMLGFYKMLKKG